MSRLGMLIPRERLLKYERAILVVILLVAVGIALLRLLNLGADMPIGITRSHTFYTDEGIYARNAAMLVSEGNWYVKGDYNSAVNYPLYFVLQVIVFKLFGVNLETLRALSAVSALAIICTVWLIVQRHAGNRAAAIAVLLISTNFLFFAYSRFGQADMPMILFIVLSLACLLLGSTTPNIASTALSGLLMLFAILTKTYAVFAVPVLLFLIWQQNKTMRRRVVHIAVLAGVLCIGLAIYYVFLFEPYRLDYYRVSGPLLIRKAKGLRGIANAFTLALKQFIGLDCDGACFGRLFCTSALIGGPLLFIFSSSLRQNIVFRTALLWLAFGLLMLSSTNYQPSRYFSHLVIPCGIILGVGVDHLLRGNQTRLLGYVMLGLVFFTCFRGTFEIVQYVSSPRYSLYEMGNSIRKEIDSEAVKSPLLLGHIAGTVSLTNSMLSVGGLFDHENVDFRINQFLPTHFLELGPASKNANKLFAEANYKLKFLRQYDVFDNYGGKPVYFYRVISLKPNSNALTSFLTNSHD